MSRVSFVLLALLAVTAFAWAASGIEVLSHTVTDDGIEVLSRSDTGDHVVALRLIAGAWVAVDAADLDEDGRAALLFAELEPHEARILLCNAEGAVINLVTYVGQLNWE